MGSTRRPPGAVVTMALDPNVHDWFGKQVNRIASEERIAAVALSSQSVTSSQSTRVRLRCAKVRRNRARMPCYALSKVAVQVSRVRIGRGVSCMLTGTTSVDDDHGLTAANGRS
jgi:hypothetical protein